MIVRILLATVLIFEVSCGNKAITSISESGKDYLTFTSGGGFAGRYSTYVILDNGQIFQQTNDISDAIPVGKLDKQFAKQAFASYDFLDLGNVDYDKPGNYTYSIAHSSKGNTHLIQWEKDVNECKVYQQYFKNIMSMVKRATQDTVAPAKPTTKDK